MQVPDKLTEEQKAALLAFDEAMGGTFEKTEEKHKEESESSKSDDKKKKKKGFFK